MRFWARTLRSPLFLVAASVSVVALAASSPIYPATGGAHVVRSASAFTAGPGTSTASGDCSETTARQVVEQYPEVNIFDLPNPVQQVLCGSFTGPDSDAMAVTIGAPTCWPIQNWAVFRFNAGDWQLVLNQPSYLVPPLAAFGADIRETTAVHRKGDARCFFNGGTRARSWHWDGTHLVAGPWKQVSKGEPRAKGFYSPSHNIYCGMYDDSTYRFVECASYKPMQKVTLKVSGRVTICRDRGTRNVCNIGNPGEGTPKLAYGRQITVGRFRCLSRRSGVRCTVIKSGKGFLINRDRITRVGP
jgi:hypothetical protein